VAFVTPRVGQGATPSSWLDAARVADTVAIYMGAGDAAVISEALIRAGKPASTPVALIENATRSDTRTLAGTLLDLPAIAAQLSGGAAMILVGEVLRPAASAARRTTRKAQAR
jgi:siroheme synthase